MAQVAEASCATAGGSSRDEQLTSTTTYPHPANCRWWLELRALRVAFCCSGCSLAVRSQGAPPPGQVIGCPGPGLRLRGTKYFSTTRLHCRNRAQYRASGRHRIAPMDRMQHGPNAEIPAGRSSPLPPMIMIWSDRLAGGILEITAGLAKCPQIELGVVRAGDRTCWFWKLYGSKRLWWVRPANA